MDGFPIGVHAVTYELQPVFHSLYLGLVMSYWAHDLRRTAASMMAGMGVPRLVISKILNHVEPGVTKVYDRYSYDKEKQEALNIWGARMASIVEAKQELSEAEDRAPKLAGTAAK